MSRYSQPERAMRRRAADRSLSRDVESYFGDGEAMLGRVGDYLLVERAFAERSGDRVRLAALMGAQSILRAARQRLFAKEDVPF